MNMRASATSLLLPLTLATGCTGTGSGSTDEGTATDGEDASGSGSTSGGSASGGSTGSTSGSTTGTSGATSTGSTTGTSGGSTTGGSSDSGSSGGETSSGGTSAGEDSSGTGGDSGAETGEGGETGGGEHCVDDNRVIAYLANWDACPSSEQLAQYSHVVIAFAVTYTWSSGGNICNEDCALMPVDGCSGTNLADLVDDLHAAGVKVLVSIGGAGMGGTWEGECGTFTRCWDHCVDRAEQLAGELVDLVVEHDLDGIDVDYEYCLHDQAHRDFLADLTTGLRTGMDAAFPGERKLLTHVPMDSEVDVGDEYFAIAQDLADEIDLLMPQYYNGGNSPFSPGGLADIQDHYDHLVDDIYGGDASRVVFGYCIEPGCNPVATQPEALEVTQGFAERHPNNGGIFFWAHPEDTDAWFSAPFREWYDEICGG